MLSKMPVCCFGACFVASLLAALAIPCGSHAAEIEAKPRSDTEANSAAKSWALKEYTTAAARVQAARDKTLQDSLGGQAGLAREISKMSAERLAQSDYSDTFPFFEYDLPPGTYTVRLQHTDAAYHNEFYVGVPKKIGGHYPYQQELEVVHGVINNRDSTKPITFTLKVRTTLRFAAWANRDSVGWEAVLHAGKMAGPRDQVLDRGFGPARAPRL
jgi:hypothetical protein